MAPQIEIPSSDETQASRDQTKQVVVVIGNGMVGHRFLERMKRYDTARQFSLVSIGEEPIQHYNRMLLTEYFEHLSIEKLKLATTPEWYEENEIALKISSRATKIDINTKTVICQESHVWDGNTTRGDAVNTNSKEFIVSYDHLVIATGATALVPNIRGASLNGVFVYRTIQDLNDIIAYGEAQREQETNQGAPKKYALVIGGGLLGLEAAKAIHDLKVSVRIINRGSRLMSRQLDDAGAKVLHNEITSKFGIEVLYHKSTKDIQGDYDVQGVDFTDGSSFDDVFMVVFATGIKPRDDLAHTSGLEVAVRGGGIQVNDYLETSTEAVYAIGECVSHRDVTYGLVAPGYEMADSLAKNLASDNSTERVLFTGSDSSTKLKLMGTEVASFGTYFPEDITEPFEELVYNNPLERVYKKLIFSTDGKKLLGGIMVGDASDFPRLTLMCKMKDQKPLTEFPNEILLGKRDSKGGGNAILDLPDEAQVCSCNNVTKGEMCKTIRDQKLSTLVDVKKVCNVGTGCGGCMPMVKDLFEAELAAAGTAIDKSLCEHFEYSRQELYQIILVEKYETFTELLSKHGRKPNNPNQHGCEICKPTVASIFASLMNHHVLLGDRASLQDTNDRFLANIQKSGQFSIVPRVAGGEITPEKLIVLGKVAKKYNLYSKITGGQRIDLFGAEKYDLPAIWQELVEAGFESGHAYGKSLRTVKSCVGSTWCRFGVQDAVGFAIFLEDRYKGVRSPHKIKGGVSGCTRECAEARGKDFGCIATEKGYNVYVCGNGGTNPKHAVLLAPDVPQDLCVKYLDRFLMYYIRTADRLQRTSKWLDSLEGGIEQLRRVVIDDSLGIAATLEKQMEYLLNTYECEWKKVVETPELRAQFAQFRNTSATQQETAMVEERGQLFPVGKTVLKHKVRELSFGDSKPVNSPSTGGLGSVDSPTSISEILLEAEMDWIPFGSKELFDVNSGGAVLYGETQLAVFNITEVYNGIERVSWFATQNMCPHDYAFVLAQGILGDADGRPKVVCPMHKKSYDLVDGSCMSGEEALRLETFRVREDDDGQISLLLPPADVLNARLGTFNFVHLSADVSDKSSISKSSRVARVARVTPSSKPSISGGCGSKSFDW